MLVLGASFARSVAADPVGRHLEVTPYGGFTLFDGDQRVNGHSLRDDLYLGARVGYQFHPMWSIEGAGGFTPTAEDLVHGADVDFYSYSADVVFTPWAKLFGTPFAFAGGGSSQVNPTPGPTNSQLRESFGTFDAGGGLKLWLTDALGLRLEARMLYYKNGGLAITHLVMGTGLTFAFGGKPRDTDQDGVPDRKDTCPGTPKGATVDASGCPKDSDGDGVLDGLDKCPNTPKGCTIDKSGCQTDADGDGVCDGIDQCPDTPKGATVDATGCPKDSDGDGVLDGLDQCADTPKGATVDAKGCPSDSDNDGVPDGIDKCPDTSPGLKVDDKGCPIEVIEKETELLDTGMIRLHNVNFATGKADLLPEDMPVLDVVGHVLVNWPQLQIEIGGHTDSRGTARYNQRLSEARSKAVKDYLIQKFPTLKPEQFTFKGYGSSKPMVPNTSELNLAKNRRVEFVVQNKDVLKKERTRRHLLEKGETAPSPAPSPTPAPADTTQH
jgi:outer membrane protein OmpA-like peptidoglycan-associated protein